jgi:N-acetylmuramoyl-L-alanine amidase
MYASRRTGVAILLLLGTTLPERAQAFTVAIDPGHGGIKDGAASRAGVKEKDVALAISRQLKVLLEQTPDVKVLLTRDADVHVELQDRTKAANAGKADVLLSIHCNSMATPAGRRETSGVETYFLSPDATDASAQALAELENSDVSQAADTASADPISMILHDLSRTEAHADSKRLAEQVHSTLVKAVRAKDRGVRQAPFIVLLGAEMPAVLVEIGFISHPVEGRRLAQPVYQGQIASALRDALLRFRDTVFAKRTAPEGGAVIHVQP